MFQDSKEESLQRYLERQKRRFEMHRPNQINTPTEPVVEPHELKLTFPNNVWDNSQYGDLDSLISYCQEVNRVPENARVEVQFEDLNEDFHVKFNWWTIKYSEFAPR